MCFDADFYLQSDWKSGFAPENGRCKPAAAPEKGEPEMSIQIGLQLYTIRDHAEKDPEASLRAVAEMGYKGVEFAGYYGYTPGELGALLTRFGLTAAGSHVGLELLEKDPALQFEYAQALGLRTITLPWLAPELLLAPETFGKVEKIRLAAEAQGLKLAFHNHNREFDPAAGGAVKLDAFLSGAYGVELELDTYWAAEAGADPFAWMNQCAGRLSAIHIKDMYEDPARRGRNANIGEGCLDIAGYLKTADSLGVEWAFVEMDAADGDSLECAAASRKNLKKMGY